MDKRSEIISMVERRRHWPAEEKLRIMEEVLAPGVTLALYSFECFTGFNVERGVSDGRRHYLYRDDFVMKGVVHEHTQFDRHIPCTLKIHDNGTASEDDDDLGSLMLTHLTRDEREPHEQRELLLEAHVDDTVGRYASALKQCLRDAALFPAHSLCT
jgi:hypothetical protein